MKQGIIICLTKEITFGPTWQRKRIFAELCDPKTMLQVSRATGINHKSDDDLTRMFDIIKAYVLCHFDDSQLAIPRDLSDSWEQRVKPIIDKGAGI